jgi:glycosyltransferase involved in cell wall biosynthesis
MKIGIDASRISISEKTGTENYSYNLIRELIKDDKDKFVLYLRGAKPDFIINSFGIQTKRISFPKLWTQAGLAKEVLINPPDVLFIPAHTIPLIRRPGLKTVVTVHDLGAEYLPQYHKFPQKLYLNRTTEYVAKYATHLIAVSQATKDALIQRLHVSPERITVVYESWDRSIFHLPSEGELNQVRGEYRLEKPYILFLGTIQPRKNLERLIEAFSRARIKEDLVLAGKSGWMNEPIYMAARKLGVGARVKFLGHVPNKYLSALYGGSSAFIFPSLYEGFGIPVLEAMACGAVVLTSSTTSLPEVGGDAALYVDPENTRSIKNGIEEILSNGILRHQLLSKGKLQVQKFSWERAAKETLDVLRKTYED